MVSEVWNHPEENDGVIWGFFSFFLARGSGGFVSLAMHLTVRCSKDACTYACTPLLFLVCKLTFINLTFFIHKRNQVS